MDAVLNWVWQGSVVAVALAVMLRLLERARASVRCALCWAALFLVISLPVVSWLAARAPRPERLAALSSAVVSVPDTWWTSGALMMVAWAAWAAVQSIRFVRALVSLRRTRSRRQPFPATVEAALPHWSQMRHGGRRPSLALSDCVTAAAVLGCGKPVIVVAPPLLGSLDAGELDRVLIHEWAHVQRRDDQVQLLQVIVRIVAGWHPAVWWIDRRLHLEREIACDELTVAITGSPKSYAACLVKLAGLRAAERTLQAAPALCRAPGLRARVMKLLSGRGFIHPLWSRSLAAGVLSMLCAVSLAVAGVNLVESTVLAVPFASAPSGDGPNAPGPVLSEPAIRKALPRSSRAPFAPAVSEQRPTAPAPTPSVAPAPQEPDVAPQLPSEPSIALDTKSPLPLPASVENGIDGATVRETTAVHDALPSSPSEMASASSPWAAAAEGGTVLGRTSKDAGVATAGFFTRLARRVAGSF
jgi:beta-lactamase regulating signal transducer with metallopeptidase domain